MQNSVCVVASAFAPFFRLLSNSKARRTHKGAFDSVASTAERVPGVTTPRAALDLRRAPHRN